MLLSGRLLDNVANVNQFDWTDTAKFTEGDAPPVYFQLINQSQDRKELGFNPTGRRYMPDASATLEVTISSIDDAKIIVRAATQPFANDPSIWKLTLFPTDYLRGTFDFLLKLSEPVENEDPKVTRGRIREAVYVIPQQSAC